MAKAASQSHELHTEHNRSALISGWENISKTHSILHFTDTPENS